MQRTALRNGRRHHHSEYDLAADYANIKDALSEASYDIKGRLGEIVANSLADAKVKSSDLQDRAAGYITKQPLKAVGIAAVSGLVFGLLLRRR